MAKSLDEMVSAFRTRDLRATKYPYIWLDALAVKCRENKRVVTVAVVVATGVRVDGLREVLSLDVITSEDRAGWTTFLQDRTSRGSSGVRLAISDAHPGLTDSTATVLPGASWQRCRTHFMRNVLTRVPKSQQDFVASMVRTIFSQHTAGTVEAQYTHVADQLEGLSSETAQMLDDAKADILSCARFPKVRWRQIWPNHPQERLNGEIRRRTDVVGIFPNRSVLVGLVGAVLAEQSDERAVGRRYLSLESMDQIEPKPVPVPTRKSQKAVKYRLPSLHERMETRGGSGGVTPIDRT